MDYIEVYVLPDQQTNPSFDKDIFQELLRYFKKKISSRKYACFQKQVIKSFSKNLILEETYDDILTQTIPVKENMYTLNNKSLKNTLYESLIPLGIVNYSSKQIKPIHKFPSTTELYEKTLEEKVVFKINNRLFVNFSTTTYKSDPNEKYYYIYMNYNNSDKCDVKMNVTSMIDICSIIKEGYTITMNNN